MRELARELSGRAAVITVGLAVVAVVVYLIYRSMRSDTGPAVERAIEGAADLAKGLPSFVGSKLRGESEAGYITDAEQKRLAAEALAAKIKSAGN